jgi:DNA-binding beta-propeller fold protein YncE
MRLRSAPVLAGALVLLILAVAGFAASRQTGSASVAPINSVAVIDPRLNRVVGSVPVGVDPAKLAFGSGSIWVANVQDATVSRIDPISRMVVRTIPVGAPATGLAAGGGYVWVARVSGALRRIDPAFDAVTQGLAPHDYSRAFGFEIDNSLNQLSPVAVSAGSVWFGHDTAVARIDAGSGAQAQVFGAGLSPSGIAIGDGATWVTDSVDDTVTRLDPDGVATDVAVGHAPAAVAVGEGAVWVADAQDNAVVEIDPDTSSPADDRRCRRHRRT